MIPLQMILQRIRCILEKCHADRVSLYNYQLIEAVQGYAGYVVDGDDPVRDLAEEVKRLL